jgi:anti-sigma regulatory factor (Ser/Thr protein kinase)
VLLHQEVADGVEVLSVRGPVADHEAAPLFAAVQQALAAEPRAVVLDLAQVSMLSERARAALGSLPPLREGRAVAALVVCPPAHSPDMTGWLHANDREEALARVERRATPRTVIQVEHSLHGPAQARAAVHECVGRLGLDAQVADDVVLLVSEMVTNAVRYAMPPVRLEIQAGTEDVVVAVRDGSPRLPVPRHADESAEGGRGMLLVDMLTSDHGVHPAPPGKAIWARLRRSGGS